MWLDLTQLVKELGIENLQNKQDAHPPMSYII
jgi:hypothetical protein